MTFKLKQRVVLSEKSLYSRDNFQKGGNHLSTTKAGTIVKVGKDLEEGWYLVKFTSNGQEKKNSYREGMLKLK